MPFYRIGEPGADGWAHLNFGGRKATAKNAPGHCGCPRFDKDNPRIGNLCGRMSVALCDGPGEAYAGRDSTCDRPMCEGHRLKHSTKPNTDYCPEHAALAGASREPGEEG